MKILLVVILGSVLLTVGYLNQDKIGFSAKMDSSYRASVRLENELLASIRRVLEQPLTCGINLVDIPFDSEAFQSGGTVEIPSIALAGGVITSPGDERAGLRTTGLRMTGTHYADLGPGPVGMHRYRATVRLETEKIGPGATGAPRQVSDTPVNVCVDTATRRIISCDPCPGVIPPGGDCAPGAPFRCHWHPCTRTTGSGPTLQCVAWTSDVQCVADCSDCDAYPSIPGEFVRNCRRAPF